MRRAAERGEAMQQSIQLEVQRVRQRVSIQIWRGYQDHINARMRYADPSNDEKAQNIDGSERERGDSNSHTTAIPGRLKKGHLAPPGGA